MANLIDRVALFSSKGLNSTAIKYSIIIAIFLAGYLSRIRRDCAAGHDSFLLGSID